MATQVVQPTISASDEELPRQRLRMMILAVCVVTTVFRASYSSIDFRIASGANRDTQLVLAALDFASRPLLYLAIWWRLRSPNARIPVGIAIGDSADALFRILRSVVSPVVSTAVAPLAVRAYRPFISLLFLLVFCLALIVVQSLKDRRALVAVGIPVGWFYDKAIASALAFVRGFLAFGHMV